MSSQSPGLEPEAAVEPQAERQPWSAPVCEVVAIRDKTLGGGAGDLDFTDAS